MLLLVAAFLLFAIYLYVKKRKMLNHWKKKGVKFIEPLPVFGNVLPLVIKRFSHPEFVQYLYNTFPNERYFGVFQFGTPVLVLRDPELFKDVAVKSFDNFTDHTGFISPEVDPLWGKNLFASKGDRWRELRQTISPVFTSSKMKAMFVLMQETAEQLVDYLNERKEMVLEVEMKDLASRAMADVIANTAFGIKCDSLKNENNEFIKKGRELTDFSGIKRFKFLMYGSFPTLTKLLNLKVISDRVGTFFTSIILENITLREEKKIVRPDLINLLVLSRNGQLKYEDLLNMTDAGFATVQESDIGKTSTSNKFLTDEDITAQALIFFFGGFDTTSTLLCFAAHELAVNTNIQDRLREEITKTMEKVHGKISYEALLSMKYLDMVISETLRKWPQAIYLDRVCTKAFTIEPTRKEETPVRIEVGDVCWWPLFAIHRDPNFYTNPDVFDPERFSDENKDNISPFTFAPFGVGPRNCIGNRFALLENKLLLFHILLNFEIIPIAKTQIPLKTKKDSYLLTAENDFHVGLRRLS